MAPLVETRRAMRGIDLVAASILMAELGDITRFDSPRPLIGGLGQVPCAKGKRSTVVVAAVARTCRLCVGGRLLRPMPRIADRNSESQSTSLPRRG